MDENYNRIRFPLRFNETLKKLQDIAEYKKLNKLDKPLLKSRGLASY